MPYAKQLRDKAKAVKELLAPMAFASDRVFSEIEASPLPLGYRSSTKVCLNRDTFGRQSIGLYARGTKQVVDIIPECPAHHNDVNRLLVRLFAPNMSLPAPFYQHKKRSFQAGCLKFATVRLGTNGAGVILSHTGVDYGLLTSWAKSLGLRDVSLYAASLTPGDLDRVLTDGAIHLSGPLTFKHTLLGQDFELTPGAFFQANFALTDTFIKHVVDGMGGEGLLDLYGGFGAYTAACGENFTRLWIVDGSKEAIAGAERSLKRRFASLTAVHDSVEDFLDKRLSNGGREVTHVIVNPPRAGLSPRVKARLQKAYLPRLEALTYVSCNPVTLARDLKDMVRKGYKIRSIKPFDMFPQTEHVEVVAKLTLAATL